MVLVLFLALEHFLFAVKLAVAAAVPDASLSVMEQIARSNYLNAALIEAA